MVKVTTNSFITESDFFFNIKPDTCWLSRTIREEGQGGDGGGLPHLFLKKLQKFSMPGLFSSVFDEMFLKVS